MFVWRNNSSACFFLLPRFLGKFYIILLSLPALNVHLGKHCVVLDAKQSSNHWLHKHDHCVSPNQLFLYTNIFNFFLHIRGTTSKFCLINEPWNCLVLFSLIHFDMCRSSKTQPAKTNGRLQRWRPLPWTAFSSMFLLNRQPSQTPCLDCWPNPEPPKPWRPWLRSTSPFCPTNLR